MDVQYGTSSYGFYFRTMKDVVDFLNYEGLTVSPITDPTTGIQPLINYDASMLEIQQAIMTYWAPLNQEPAGSQFKMATNGIYQNQYNSGTDYKTVDT